jgi:hypothetical protein
MLAMKYVSLAPPRFDPFFPDLFAQIRNVNIHKVGQAVIVLVEDVIVDRGSANHFVLMECQKFKNGKFASRQNDG